ncbi:tyrosine-type recombinase/integrase [Arcobacter sp. FWKO B]|uniref:tyrosine-type recombinase/integrase n=1 Tax=Arcobacter sp. FWKO B TaxID=2593672 RepID=UPI0018A38E87|nr:tyrosine-type recombinase/integrase [Arcobacter sp. FWKO B]QOG12677.1 phage integrase family protein [Arcobacter sp. FWKO B]
MNKRFRKELGYEKDSFRTNLERAFREKEKFLNDVKSGIDFKRPDTLDNLAKEYFESCKATEIEQGHKTKVSYYNKHFSPKIGNKKFDNILQRDIQPIIDEFYKTKVPFKSSYYQPKTCEKLVDVRKAWDRIKKAAELEKHFTIHNIRHLLGNIARNRANQPLDSIAKMLGHSTTGATGIYADLAKEKAFESLNETWNILLNNKVN